MPKVYFTDMRTDHRNNLIEKTKRLFLKAGFASLIDKGDLVAIKLHWGEPGNLAYINPPLVRAIVDEIKKAGGKPFITDANTLYNGRRRNAVDNIQSALENGFAYATVGAPVVVADGLHGENMIKVPLNNGIRVKEAAIAGSIVEADAIICLSHVKGHELFGFGGALKNMGMGCAAPAGKQVLHSDVLPEVNHEICVGCGICSKRCPVSAITLTERKANIDHKICYGCGECVTFCPHGAIPINWKTDQAACQEKTAEYAYAATLNKLNKVGYINFIKDVSPDCDCAPWNDTPIVPNLGLLASTDPVAVDQASLDLIAQAPALPNSRLPEKGAGERFSLLHGVDTSIILSHGEKIGLGKREYQLQKI